MSALWHELVGWSDALQELASSSHSWIPELAVERELQGLLSLSKDQLRFMLAMFSSVSVGLGIRAIRNPTARHLYALVTGILLLYFPFGAGVIHAFPPALITYLAMLVAPKRCGNIAWWINFPYLIYLHVVNASGTSWMKGVMDFTGCEMVLVLKLISVAMCYQDYHTKKKEELTSFQAAHMLSKPPSLLEYLSYIFSLGNLLSGPYFEFADYKQFIEHKGVWDPAGNQGKPQPSFIVPSMRCIAETTLYMAMYLQLIPNFGVDVFTSKWYQLAPGHIKLATIFISGITNQLKYAFAWKLSESSLTLAGLNFEGWDEKTGQPLWGRVRNVRWFRLLTCDSARTVPQYWNIGTGIFLRRYVYERLVPKGRKPGFLQLLATQITSALWHGLYAGYLLFFVGTAIWIYFSTLLYKAEQKWAPNVSKLLPWRVAKIAWTNMVLNYMASAFMVLELKGSLAVYASVHYVPHIIMIVGCLVGPMVLGKGYRRDKSHAKIDGKSE